MRAPVASSSAMTPSASGWPAHVRNLAQSSAASHSSAIPSNWKSSMYHDFSRCSSGRWERGRVPDRERDQVVDPVGRSDSR